MPDLLTGIALQRAIAEKKGWHSFHEGPDGLCGTFSVTRGISYIPRYDDDLSESHALLAELVEAKDASKRWAIECTINMGGYYFVARRGDRVVDVQAPDFCTAVGNLWLRCGE